MQSVEEILKRNSRVELDKAWEVSRTRRLIIATITYLTTVVFLRLIGNESPFLNALVPAGGYLLSTLSLQLFKSCWIESKNKIK